MRAIISTYKESEELSEIQVDPQYQQKIAKLEEPQLPMERTFFPL